MSEDPITIDSHLTVGILSVFLVAFLLNATTACLAIRKLKRKLHNLLIICLWVNNGMVCFIVMIHKIVKMSVNPYDNKVFCQILGIVLSYSLLTSYVIIFLVGWVRYVTIKTFNIGTEERLERHKWHVVIGTHTVSLVASVLVNVLLPTTADHINSCSPYHIYAKNFPIYMGVLWTPVTLFLFSVIIIYAVNTYYIWKLFFKQSMKITPLAITAVFGQRRMLTEEINLSSDTEMKTDKKAVPLETNVNKSPEKGLKANAEINATVETISTSEIEVNVEVHENVSQRKKNAIEIQNEIKGSKSCKNRHRENGCPSELTGKLKSQQIAFETTPVEVMDDTQNSTDFKGDIRSLSEVEIKLDDNVDALRLHQDRADILVEQPVRGKGDNDVQLTTRHAEKRDWEIRAFKTNLLIAVSTTVFSSPFVFSLWCELLLDAAIPLSIHNVLFAFSIINFIFDPFYYAFRVPEIRKELRCWLCKTKTRGNK